MLLEATSICENPNCNKYRNANNLNFCKHALCLLLERREKTTSIEYSEVLASNEYYYEHILCKRYNNVTKEFEYLVKCGLSKRQDGKGVQKWGYGSDLTWESEKNIRKTQNEYCGIDHYHNILICLNYHCLHRKNAW